jgi:hypothetical protein
MALKWNDQNKEKNPEDMIDANKTYTIKDILSDISDEDEKRAEISHTIDDEIKAMIEEEIKNAAHELVEEQVMVIRAAVEENKKIIREILEQEIAAIRTKEYHIRESLQNYRLK